MSGLTLTLRAPPEQRLDLSGLVPDKLAGLEVPAIERLEIGTTREVVRVGDIFAVQSGDPENIVIAGGSERFDRVGEGMRGGALLLEGNAGMRAGRALAGGRVTITGSVGPFAASGMVDGLLEIGRDAGAFLGGPLAGERAGMRGGIVLVRGGTGDRAADRLRRGLIVIAGDAGRHAGSCMIAGTLVILGGAGEGLGTLMRRGTILLGRPRDLAPSFVRVGHATAVFQRLLSRALAPVSPGAASLAIAPSSRFSGDMASLGRGEVFMPV